MAKAKTSETSTDRTIAAKQLIALVKDCDQKKTKIASHVGEIGERIKSAVENGNLHKAAFGLIVKLFRMDEDKRNDFLRQFPLYVDMCRDAGLFGSEHVGDLVEDAEAEDRAARKAAVEGEIQDIVETNTALLGGISELHDDEALKSFDDETSPKPSRRAKRNGGLPGADGESGYRVTGVH
jgi:hypothetical protein